MNNGPGVAMIRSVHYFVEGKPMADLDAALRAGGLDPNRAHGFEFRNEGLRVGKDEWLLDYRSRDDAENRRAIDFIGSRLAAETEYCSVTSKCWKYCSRDGACGQQAPKKR